MGENASVFAMKLASDLRSEGFAAESDLIGRSLKAQMKYADKIGAKYSMVIGDNELAEGRAKVKNMSTGETADLDLNGDLSTRSSPSWPALWKPATFPPRPFPAC